MFFWFFLSFVLHNQLQLRGAVDPQRKELPGAAVAPAVGDEELQAPHGGGLVI